MKMHLLSVIAALALSAGCAKSPSVDAAAQDATPVAEVPAASPAAPPAAPAEEPAAGTITTPENPEENVGKTGAAPAIAVGEPHPRAPGAVDASCGTDADCAIKDVGSCCGYRPACVNKASPTFPEQVQAACAKDGRMGICGFPAISGCKCTAGQCEGTGSGAGEQVH